MDKTSNEPQCVKEASKLEIVESSLDETSSIITGIFQKVSNIEEKLDEQCPLCDDCSSKEEASSSRLTRLSDNVRSKNSNLREISDRLQKILDLF